MHKQRNVDRRGDSNRWMSPMWAAIATILLLPLVAMRFTREVTWDASDFAAAGALLIGAGAVYELAKWSTGNPICRVIIGAGLVSVVVLTWLHGAVGIF